MLTDFINLSFQNNQNHMRNSIKNFLILFFPIVIFCLNTKGNPAESDVLELFQVRDTGFIELSGVVKDADTKLPVVFAHVSLEGTNIGTVSNTDGRFLLKIPSSHIRGEISVTSLGYKNLTISISELQKIGNEIQLEMIRFLIKEVIVRNMEAVDLLHEVKKKIPQNYGETPSMFTAFYRETIKQNRNYVAVSEAVFDVYKAPYSIFAEDDRIKIFKGRKSQDVEKMDTVLFKLQGGPYNLFILDVAKHFDEILPNEYFDYYNFSYDGQESIQDRDVYIVAFNQKPGIQMPLYQGKIYIDVETLAISSMEFNLSPYGIQYAPAVMILKKPLGMKVEIPGANYIVKYRYSNNRWYLNYSRSEARFRCKWNQKLFRSNYATMSEMAVTDVEQDSIVKFKLRESTRSNEIFSEVVSDFEDPDFWGEYNIIRPEITIDEATKKLSRKLQRK
jgi:hypothetical protein